MLFKFYTRFKDDFYITLHYITLLLHYNFTGFSIYVCFPLPRSCIFFFSFVLLFISFLLQLEGFPSAFQLGADSSILLSE